MTAKQYQSLPQEVFEAVEKADILALRAFRESLVGDEEIAAKDTLPIFDWMIEHMSVASPDEAREMEALRIMLEQSSIKRNLADVIMELERITDERIDRELKAKSPTAYTMRKLLREKEGAPLFPAKSDIRVGDKNYSLPGEVAAALTTLRPQLLRPLRNRIKEGKLLSIKGAIGMMEIIDDYVVNSYSMVLSGSELDTKCQQLRDETSEALDDLKAGNKLNVRESLRLLDMVQAIIEDMEHNQRQGNGLHIADGQGRGRSLLSVLK